MRRLHQNENNVRKNERVHIYNTKVTKQSSKIIFPHYNKFMVKISHWKKLLKILAFSNRCVYLIKTFYNETVMPKSQNF